MPRQRRKPRHDEAAAGPALAYARHLAGTDANWRPRWRNGHVRARQRFHREPVCGSSEPRRFFRVLARDCARPRLYPGHWPVDVMEPADASRKWLRGSGGKPDDMEPGSYAEPHDPVGAPRLR